MIATDVAVVGAGPAGAWVARQLARSGARVTLFDAGDEREKPCGGGLTARTLNMVASAVSIPAIGGVAVTSVRFESGEHGSVAATFSIQERSARSYPPLVVVSRSRFDGALRESAAAAGATLVPERVIDVSVDSDGVRLKTATAEHAASYLIGADGASSLIRRRLSRPFTRDDWSMSAGYFVAGSSEPRVVIRCMADPPGYLWAFPRQDHVAVGLCAPAYLTTPAVLRHRVRSWLDDSELAARRVIRPYAWPIPTLSYHAFAQERPAGPRWMLVGDAAALVDPLTREGIYFALRSAQIAADAIAHEGAAADKAYVERLRSEIYPELRRASALRAGFFTSGFATLMVEALEASPRVRAIMIDLIAGRQPYNRLRARLIRTCEFGLAWRLLRLHLRGRWQGARQG